MNSYLHLRTRVDKAGDATPQDLAGVVRSESRPRTDGRTRNPDEEPGPGSGRSCPNPVAVPPERGVAPADLSGAHQTVGGGRPYLANARAACLTIPTLKARHNARQCVFRRRPNFLGDASVQESTNSENKR